MTAVNVDAAANDAPGSLAEDDDVRALIELVFELSGMDFRNYAFASLRRRVRLAAAEEGAATIEQLTRRVREDSSALARLLGKLTLPVTSMFRDPQFHAEFRREVVPLLRTHPYLRLWVAGCSTGQEVYSLAIVLHEEGLLERSRIYATDVQKRALDHAREGIYSVALMQDYTRNYQAAGGRAAFSDYYTADAQNAIFRPFLKSNLVFGLHNLVTDGSFNEFHVIFCRNVMIYFNAELQDRVHELLYDSLAMFGYLGLGRGETIRFSPHESRYEAVSVRDRLYRKIA
jgi:chemotaxis protein methyltransferase CheR